MTTRRLFRLGALWLAGCSSGQAPPVVSALCRLSTVPDPCFQSGLACTPDYTATSPTGAFCEPAGETFPCLRDAGCATSDLSCVGSGEQGVCLRGCTSSADCWDPLTSCADAGAQRLCLPNPCATPWAPCDAAVRDGGDGTCVVIDDQAGNACLQGGTVLDGGACGYFRGSDAGLCAPGSLCLTNLDGSNAGVCMPICDASANGDAGPACGGGCTFASPPGPPPGLSRIDFFNHSGGCAPLCTAADAKQDAGCPAPLACLDDGMVGPGEFVCLPE